MAASRLPRNMFIAQLENSQAVLWLWLVTAAGADRCTIGWSRTRFSGRAGDVGNMLELNLRMYGRQDNIRVKYTLVGEACHLPALPSA